MNDLTLLYYTDNTLEEKTRKKIANNLIKVTGNRYPIISVSQKPIKLGKNICVGEIGKSKYNAYKQILIGADEVRTKYIACIDDDTLYSKEHFEFRPDRDTFSYQTNYWFAQPEIDYYWRIHNMEKRGGMWGCICTKDILIKHLSKRYKTYNSDPFANHTKVPSLVWGEPGIHEQSFDMENKNIKHSSPNPCVIFIHPLSMGYNQLKKFYRRYGYPLPEDKCTTLKQFGNINKLFNNYFK